MNTTSKKAPAPIIPKYSTPELNRVKRAKYTNATHNVMTVPTNAAKNDEPNAKPSRASGIV